MVARVTPRDVLAIHTGIPRSETLRWSLVLHPRRTALCMAGNQSQPPEGTVWARARSRVVRIIVRSP